MFKQLILSAFILSALTNLSYGQLTVSSGLTAEEYVDILVGDGITFYDAQYFGNEHSIGKFSTGIHSTNLGIKEGLIISTGIVDATGGASPIGSPVINKGDTGFNHNSDEQLQSLIPNYDIYDATFITFKFVPQSDSISFKYVFASEEYPEWVGASYNDVFGFFISGPNPNGADYNNKNIALIPNSPGLPVSINNINRTSNYWQFYVDNEELNGQSIIFDGFTKVLTAVIKVVPCEEYSIKLAIGDAGDSTYDSGVFLMANSLNSPHFKANAVYSNGSVQEETTIEGGCNDSKISFNLSSAIAQDYLINLEISGTATNGVDYEKIPSQLIIPAGQDSITIDIKPLEDNIIEGTENIIIVTNNQFGCMTGNDTVTINIKDYTEIDLNLSPDTAICGGEATISTNPTNGFSPYIISWDNIITDENVQIVAPSETTTYTVSVTDVCNVTKTGQITVSMAEGYANAGNDIEICLGKSTTITVNEAKKYLWSTGDTTRSITVSPTTESTYFVTVTDLCEGYDTVVVKTIDLPIITASSEPSEICLGESIDLIANGGLKYTWTSEPLDPSIGTQSPTTDSKITVTPRTNVTYKVVGETDKGCSNSAIVKTTVNQKPIADFFTQPDIASSFNPVFHFYDNSTGSPSIWEWTIGKDETKYNASDFEHSFDKDEYGTFDVQLIVIDNKNCSDTINGNVTVKPDYTLYVPNAFTPDDDGLNDKFHISGINLPEDKFRIQIYDRFGKLLFTSSNIAFEWDGKYNGKACPQGVYTYRIFYTDTNKIEHSVFGEILIIR